MILLLSLLLFSFGGWGGDEGDLNVIIWLIWNYIYIYLKKIKIENIYIKNKENKRMCSHSMLQSSCHWNWVILSLWLQLFLGSQIYDAPQPLPPLISQPQIDCLTFFLQLEIWPKTHTQVQHFLSNSNNRNFANKPLHCWLRYSRIHEGASQMLYECQ